MFSLSVLREKEKERETRHATDLLRSVARIGVVVRRFSTRAFLSFFFFARGEEEKRETQFSSIVQKKTQYKSELLLFFLDNTNLLF